MWNYIYFYLYLEAKKENDHNALEKYVYDQVLYTTCIQMNFLSCNYYK